MRDRSMDAGAGARIATLCLEMEELTSTSTWISSEGGDGAEETGPASFAVGIGSAGTHPFVALEESFHLLLPSRS